MNRDEKCPQWCQLKIPSEPVASRRPAGTRSWPRVFNPEGLWSLAGGITTGFPGLSSDRPGWGWGTAAKPPLGGLVPATRAGQGWFRIVGESFAYPPSLRRSGGWLTHACRCNTLCGGGHAREAAVLNDHLARQCGMRRKEKFRNSFRLRCCGIRQALRNCSWPRFAVLHCAS